MLFYGRKEELKTLRDRPRKTKAELVVLYGRRRVGKTTLVEEAYKNKAIWKFEGLEGATTKQQLRHFEEQLDVYDNPDNSVSRQIKSWYDALTALWKAIGKKKIVVFFDEFQWLAEMKPYLVSLFKYYFDNYFSACSGCVFVICGSVSSFIVKKVIRSRALYGRIDLEMHVQPMPLRDISPMFSEWQKSQLLDTYLTFGGIPKYFQIMTPTYSYEQNLAEHAFSQSGFFFHEFERLFISHFSRSTHYRTILKTLAGGTKTLDQLAEACNIEKGGGFSEIIDDLVLAGFVQKDTPIDKSHESKLIIYRLLDEYLHFYFSFIFPHIASIQTAKLHFHMIDRAPIAQWTAYAFERLCRYHSHDIADALRFSGIGYISGSWFRRSLSHRKGAQVDLLFRRDDRMLTICEIKYTKELLGKKLITDFQRRQVIIEEYFPSFRMHKVLIVGKGHSVPKEVMRFFDDILFAEDIFFS